ncbi:MAG TPA: hypothetical protein VMP03_03755 [Methylomirabilota bacterium]|nr:hypothetical protein [Methylomirabilota bacterium]
MFARHRKSAAFDPHELSASEATRFFIDVSASARTFDAPGDRTVVYVD